MTTNENIFSFRTIRDLEAAREEKEGAIITILYVVEIIAAASFLTAIAYNVWRVWHG